MTPPTPTPYSVRVVAQHPTLQPWIFYLRDGDDDPWRRLDALRRHVPSAPNTSWPTTGWILTMEVRCRACGEPRLITIEKTYKGQEIVCAVCGQAGPYVPAAGTPDSSSPTWTPRSPVPAAERR